MSSVVIRDMGAGQEYFAATCTHTEESDEIDVCARRRLAWLKSMFPKGLRVKVALQEGEPVGFLYLIPIEVCPWGPLGQDLLVIPCLVVQEKVKGKGVGRALIASAEEENLSQGRKGLVTVAYYHDFWFMPAPFFEKTGFHVVGNIREVTSEGEKEYLSGEAILWKVSDSSAEPPQFLNPNYHFQPIPGKVVVDLFWNTFCQTSNIEAQRVRDVVEEFGDAVTLREYCADDRAVLSRYQLPRGIFVNGNKIGWGYEAPKVGIREAISRQRNSEL